jgi:hypothetical protein
MQGREGPLSPGISPHPNAISGFDLLTSKKLQKPSKLTSKSPQPECSALWDGYFVLRDGYYTQEYSVIRFTISPEPFYPSNSSQNDFSCVSDLSRLY